MTVGKPAIGLVLVMYRVEQRNESYMSVSSTTFRWRNRFMFFPQKGHSSDEGAAIRGSRVGQGLE